MRHLRDAALPVICYAERSLGVVMLAVFCRHDSLSGGEKHGNTGRSRNQQLPNKREETDEHNRHLVDRRYLLLYS